MTLEELSRKYDLKTNNITISVIHRFDHELVYHVSAEEFIMGGDRFLCVKRWHLNLCQLFAEKGTDANLEDKYGQTCIYYAIREGHDYIVEFLIKHGANVNKIVKKSKLLFLMR